MEKYIDQLESGGDLFINSSIINEKVDRSDVNVHYVDTIGLAETKIGNEKTANMIMLGAIIKKTGVVNIDTMEKTFEKLMTGKKAKLIEPNMRALQAWEG